MVSVRSGAGVMSTSLPETENTVPIRIKILPSAVSRRAATAVLAAVLLFHGCSDSDPEAGGSTVLPPGIGDAGDTEKLQQLRLDDRYAEFGFEGDGKNDTDNLQQLVRLNDRYIAEFRIEGGSWKAIGPQQEIAMTFAASGLASVRQLELLLEPSPVSAFDLGSAVFEPVAPLVTLPPGTEIAGNNLLRLGAATLTDDLDGNRVLGTLTLRTSASFNALVRAHISISLLSVGPGVSQRDSYEAAELNLGIVVN